MATHREIPTIDYLYPHNTDWIIIGAESGIRKGKVKLDNQWLHNALVVLDKPKIPVFVKNNAGGVRQEYPMEAQGSVQP